MRFHTIHAICAMPCDMRYASNKKRLDLLLCALETNLATFDLDPRAIIFSDASCYLTHFSITIMAADESYMLSRNTEESKRLDTQHIFMRQLANGCLIQPSIPLTEVRAVADVATGTGIWLREAAQELSIYKDKVKFVGFDISPQQFPENGIDQVDLIVHDITKPFPEERHEKFDLVHVRFLSYALKAQDLDNAVKNIVQILRECDLCEIFH